MKINNTHYSYRIEPRTHGYIRAEIFKFINGYEELICSKRFCKRWKKSNEKDYIDAKAWVDETFRLIIKYNESDNKLEINKRTIHTFQ